MTTPTTDWPKPWLLQLHASAIESGAVFVENITLDEAESLKQRFYRVRRRSDKAMAAFIPPEYHMVMVGEWRMSLSEGVPVLNEAGTPLGNLPIIYDCLPSGQVLPTVRAVSGEEAQQLMVKPQLAEPAPKISPEAILDLNNLDVAMDSEEIDSFVDKLTSKAAKKKEV